MNSFFTPIKLTVKEFFKNEGTAGGDQRGACKVVWLCGVMDKASDFGSGGAICVLSRSFILICSV